MKFEQYLIQVGTRSLEYSYTEEQLSEAIDYFRKCWESNLSPYKALLFLEYNLPCSCEIPMPDMVNSCFKCNKTINFSKP